MRVRVKFFAIYLEVIGKNEEEYRLESGATLNDLSKLVFSTYPQLNNIQTSMLISVNENFVNDRKLRLKEGDVVAFFPTLSGG
jgi:MoaD family protein